VTSADPTGLRIVTGGGYDTDHQPPFARGGLTPGCRTLTFLKAAVAIDIHLERQT
jgi:hypothetical protein